MEAGSCFLLLLRPHYQPRPLRKVRRALLINKYMREIKFRAWDKVNKKIILTKKIEWFSNELGDSFSGTYINGQTNPTERDFILMQFTGLKDCNGKEIYEGDIVKDTHHKLSSPFAIEYGHCEVYQHFAYGFNCYEDMTGYEVIGNIYENPELIK